MNALFVHDHKFAHIEGKFYSPGGLPFYVWGRYLSAFAEITVIGRELTISKEVQKDLTISSTCGVSFELLSYVRTPLDFLRYKSKIKRQIEKTMEVKSITAAIVRLPSSLGYYTIDVCKKMDIPYAVEVVGCTFDSWYNYGNPIYKLAAPFMYKRMRKYVCKSKYIIYVTKEFLQKRYPACKSAIISYASNVELPEFGTEILTRHILSLKTKKDYLKFGMIGGNIDVKYKGYDISIRALAKIKDKIPDFRLYIVGSGEGRYIKPIIEELGLSENVILVGRIKGGDGIFNFLDSLDIYLHSSKLEGLPRSLVEAMGRGCPCLASNVGGIPELLRKDFLHEAGDYSRLSHQIYHLLSHKEELIEAAKTNFDIAKGYTSNSLSKRRKEFWMAFYKDVLNKKC